MQIWLLLLSLWLKWWERTQWSTSRRHLTPLSLFRTSTLTIEMHTRRRIALFIRENSPSTANQRILLRDSTCSTKRETKRMMGLLLTRMILPRRSALATSARTCAWITWSSIKSTQTLILWMTRLRWAFSIWQREILLNRLSSILNLESWRERFIMELLTILRYAHLFIIILL